MTATEPLSKPIIVIGAPRSGTTNLGALLSRHPSVAYLEEPRLVWRYGNDSKSDRLLPADARPEVVRHIHQVFRRAVLDAGKDRLLEKTPSNGLRLGFIDRVFPDCLIVHIIRNGLESTLAIKSFWEKSARGFTGLAPGRIGQRFKEVTLRRIPYYLTELVRRGAPKCLSGVVGPSMWGPRVPGIQQLLKDLSLVEVCALQWRMTVELACIEGRRMPPGRYCEIRIEDMSPKLLEETLQFCGLDPGLSFSGQERAFYDPGRARRRIAEADPEELTRIREWIDPTMSWLGYSESYCG
jgi:hypothetical protein